MTRLAMVGYRSQCSTSWGVVVAVLWLLLIRVVLETPLSAATAKDWRARAPFASKPAELLGAAGALAAEKKQTVTMLWAEETTTIDAQHRSTHVSWYVYRLPDSGNLAALQEWITARVFFAPWFQNRPLIRGRVINSEGRATEVDPTTLVEKPAGAVGSEQFSDIRFLAAPLPALSGGAIVELRFEIRDREPMFAAGIAESVFPSRAPFVEGGRITTIAAKSLKLHWIKRGAWTARETRSEDSSTQRIRVDFGPLSRPLHLEEGVPEVDLPEPSLTFSTATDWGVVAQSYSQIIETKLKNAHLDDLELSRLRTLQRPAAIRGVVEAVHRQVRYEGVEVGAFRIIPQTPDEVLRRGFGDCKEKALLIVAALRQLGITAHMALLKPGPTRDVPQETPGMGLFTHAIVYVPGEPDYWIEATDPGLRVGQLHAAEVGRGALLITPKTTGLTVIDRPASSQDWALRTRDVFLPHVGLGSVAENTVMSGVLETYGRSVISALKPDQLIGTFSNACRSMWMSSDVRGISVTEPRDVRTQFKWSFKAYNCQRFRATDKEVVALVPSFVFQELIPEGLREPAGTTSDPKKPQTRTFPFQLPAVLHQTNILRLHFPAGTRPRDVVPEWQKVIGPLSFSRSVNVLPSNVVEVVTVAKATTEVIPPGTFLTVVKQLSEFLSQCQVSLSFDQQVSKLIREGSFKEAIRVADEVVKADPTQAFAHRQKVTALLSAGLGDAARESAVRATLLLTNSSEAFASLGTCLEHDRLGRSRTNGFPRDQALAAHRTALRLDPENPLNVLRVCGVMLFDSQGRRYASQEDIQSSIKMTRDIREGSVDEVFRSIPPVLQLQSGDPAEWLALAAPKTQQHESFRGAQIAAMVLGKGVAAGLAEARKQGLLPPGSGTLLGHVFLFLIAAEHYDEAAEWLRNVAPQVTDFPDPAGVADTMAMVNRMATATTLPGAAVRDYLRVLLGAEDIHFLEQRVAREILQYLGTGSEVLFGTGYSPGVMLQPMMKSTGLHPRALVELILRTTELQLEGDPRFGRRVRIISKYAHWPARTLHLAMTTNGWKIVTAARLPAALCGLALSAIDSGDFVQAHQWLRWAYDADPLTKERSTLKQLWSPGELKESEMLLPALAVLVEAGAAAGLPQRFEDLSANASPIVRKVLQTALARGAFFRREHELALKLSSQLIRENPSDPDIRTLQGQVFVRFEKWDELFELSRERGSGVEQASEAAEMRVVAAFGQGRYEDGLRLVAEAEKIPTLGSAVLQKMQVQGLWGSLFVAGHQTETLNRADQLLGSSLSEDPRLVLRVAVAYAWQGKGQEARNLLLRSIAERRDDSLSALELLVLGKISESYDLVGEAIRLYEAAIKEDNNPDQPKNLRVGLLAQMQIDRLRKLRTGDAPVR